MKTVRKIHLALRGDAIVKLRSARTKFRQRGEARVRRGSHRQETLKVAMGRLRVKVVKGGESPRAIRHGLLDGIAYEQPFVHQGRMKRCWLEQFGGEDCFENRLHTFYRWLRVSGRTEKKTLLPRFRRQ